MLLADGAAGILIRGGGILVLVAVLGICVFLFAVVLPLFRGAEVGAPLRYRLPRGGEGLLFAELNEYRSLGVALYRDGVLSIFEGRAGKPLGEKRLIPEGRSITAFSREHAGGHVGLGLDDGAVVLAAVRFETRFLAEDTLPGELTALPPGGAAPFAGGVAEKTPLAQVRLSEVAVEAPDPVAAAETGAAISLIDYRAAGGAEKVAALAGAGELFSADVTRKQSLVDDRVTVRLERATLPHEPGATPPSHLALTGTGDQLYLAWPDGTFHRYDLRRIAEPVIAERGDFTPDGPLTLLDLLFGDQSLIAGDARGGVTAWFRLPALPDSGTEDGFRMVPAHRLEPQSGEVRSFASSVRDKRFATGTDRGEVWLRHMTTNRVLLRLSTREHDAGTGPNQAAAAEREPSPAVASLQIAPKADGLFAVRSDGEAFSWPLANPHPETTLGAIFGKTWYEGHAEPVHSWQSSSGTDDFEPKFGIIPLIFGTLKATFYALLFAVPVAILAAIYTSEFLSRRVRSLVKPGIELMASLPSVVLGFIAALVIAPWAENWVVSLLTVFFVTPLCVVLASYLWLLLPESWSARLDGPPKLILTGTVVFLGLWGSFPLGRAIEEAFFLGDVRAWLSPPLRGTGTAFWAALLFPLAAGAVLVARNVWRRTRSHVEPEPRSRLADAGLQIGKGLAVLAAAAAISVPAAWLLTAAGFDPRHSFVGTYVQRNTLIVGFVMGFAVIPIIYTLAEDALASVPQHLRGAALGCGATPWQTAYMIILPTAMSGIFSAVMVGVGRAVGETMIVVMAAGNTPIIDVNPFNGLRALSATIAVELPEAVKDGTLYRMLFLAAVTLFIMTFIVNTVAEVIRLRFRRKAFEL